jgi:cytochrome c oxidase assembly protein subunit 15
VRLLLRGDGLLRAAGVAVICALLLQVTLGISTLLTRMAIPVAAGHQGGAILLLTVMLITVHALRRRALPGVSSGN